jgi:pentose-5-phosphate-3-epimerase
VKKMSVSIEKKGFDFSIRVAELVRYLREDGKSFPLCERLLFCGVNAGQFIRKGKNREATELVKEADYILELAVSAGYVTKVQSEHIRSNCENLLKILNGKQVKINLEGDLS